MALSIQQYNSVNSFKRQCVEKEGAATEWDHWSLKTEEVARKKFFEHLCFQWLHCRGEPFFFKEVYVIASDFFKPVEKTYLLINAALTIMDWQPHCQVFIQWVRIPNHAFFQRVHFEKIVAAICGIPFSSRIYLFAANTWVKPQCHQQTILKQVKDEQIPPDKMIFLNFKNSPEAKKIQVIMSKTYTTIPHYYITRSSSQKPLRRLTPRSLVYFFENKRWELQTTKDLIGRGFRVVESFPKKDLSKISSRKRRDL
jgi:hypothetical protein